MILDEIGWKEEGFWQMCKKVALQAAGRDAKLAKDTGDIVCTWLSSHFSYCIIAVVIPHPDLLIKKELSFLSQVKRCILDYVTFRQSIESSYNLKVNLIYNFWLLFLIHE